MDNMKLDKEDTNNMTWDKEETDDMRQEHIVINKDICISLILLEIFDKH